LVNRFKVASPLCRLPRPAPSLAKLGPNNTTTVPESYANLFRACLLKISYAFTRVSLIASVMAPSFSVRGPALSRRPTQFPFGVSYSFPEITAPFLLFSIFLWLLLFMYLRAFLFSIFACSFSGAGFSSICLSYVRSSNRSSPSPRFAPPTNLSSPRLPLCSSFHLTWVLESFLIRLVSGILYSRSLPSATRTLSTTPSLVCVPFFQRWHPPFQRIVDL